ncbi:MAG: mechanosensitive ion channel family protein [Deltaproteobacteria bacterium]|nr:mechanosensitive ion channel family protein [Nannocystaceae bacterium]
MWNLTDGLTKLQQKLVGWLEAAVLMLPNFVLALAIVGVAVWIARWIARGVRGVLLRVTNNRTVSGLVAAVCRIAVVVAATFVALGVLSLDKAVTSLLAGIGVIGLALGFAFQDIAANFMSGLIMAVKRPFSEGDLVEIGGRVGRIREIELRSTELDTLDGLSVTVPNKDVIQNQIVNYTRTPSRRVEFTLGTSYADDMQQVREVVLGAVQQLAHRDPERDVELYFTGFGDSSIDCVVRVWLTVSEEIAWLEARSEALVAIKKAFDHAKITIPFPIRTLDFGAELVGGARFDARASPSLSNS